VDHGPRYPPAKEQFVLRYKQETFGERNPMGSMFHVLKQKTKRFYNGIPFYGSLKSLFSNLTSFMRMQNILAILDKPINGRDKS
jgi:hypothetical protein